MARKAEFADLLKSPAAFRRAILVDVDGEPQPFRPDDWQRQDFEAMDPAWMRLAGIDPPANTDVKQRAYLERPRGHSKTTDIAISGTWVLAASRRKLLGVVAAGDQDQARLIRDAIDTLCRMNPWLAGLLEVQANRIINSHTGSELRILTSDGPTSYGLTPDFIICDELTHWRNRDLWDSLFSAAAKRAHCVLLIIANAGFSDSWQHAVYVAIQSDPAWYFHSLPGPCASWITADRLAEQRRLLPAIAYARVWLNQLSAGAGDAIETSQIAAAFSLSAPPAGPENGWVYVGGLDIGISRDASAFVAIGKHVGWTEQRSTTRRPRGTAAIMDDLGIADIHKTETETIHYPGSGRYRLSRLAIWKPTRGEKVQLADVEREILAAHRLFNLQCVAVDPSQAEYLIQRLQEQGVAAIATPFVAQNIRGMTTATLETFVEQNIELFEHEQLRADLGKLRIVEMSYGFKLDSPRGRDGHGDSATALSLSLLAAKDIMPAHLGRVQGELICYP
jgi:hypothetical protein